MIWLAVPFYVDESSATSDYASDLKYSNDSYWEKPVVELTKGHRGDSISDSVGRVWYARPVPLWDLATGELASFDTAFSFRIRNDDGGASPGDGMAFFLAYYPSVTPTNSGGGGLGLFSTGIISNGSRTAASGDERLVAVEFDTYSNNQQWPDSAQQHVGIDVNSIVSAASKDTDTPGRNLSSGYLMEARVSYRSDTTLLAADLDVGDAHYHISYNVDLKQVLPENVSVGFSAATGERVELHQLLSWSFNSSDLLQEAAAAAAAGGKKPQPPGSTEIASSAAAPDQAHQVPNSRKLRRLSPERLAIAVLAALLAMAIFLLIACNLRKQQVSRWCHGGAAEKQDSGPRRYQYCQLVKATDKFDPKRLLGEGGSGIVYLGDDDNGRKVAVKKLSSVSMGTTSDEESQRRMRREFETEVNIISRLRHKNLVRLFGWCDDRSNGLHPLLQNRALFLHICPGRYWTRDK